MFAWFTSSALSTWSRVMEASWRAVLMPNLSASFAASMALTLSTSSGTASGQCGYMYPEITGCAGFSKSLYHMLVVEG